MARFFGPKAHLGRGTWKAYVVAAVAEATNKPHDKEVSALIAAVSNDEEYSAEVHKEWRLRNQTFIEQMREIYRRSQAPPPPPSAR